MPSDDEFPALEKLMEYPKQAIARKKTGAAKRMTDIILCALVGFILIAMVILNAKSNNSYTILGYSGFTMLTESMQSDIPKGALLITQKTDASSIKLYDDIAFTRDDGTVVTHRVINIIENYGESGLRGFKTQGTENTAPDADIIHAEKVIGVVKLSVPGLGTVLNYISENIGIVLLLFGVILIAAIVAGKRLSGREKF